MVVDISAAISIIKADIKSLDVNLISNHLAIAIFAALQKTKNPYSSRNYIIKLAIASVKEMQNSSIPSSFDSNNIHIINIANATVDALIKENIIQCFAGRNEEEDFFMLLSNYNAEQPYKRNVSFWFRFLELRHLFTFLFF